MSDTRTTFQKREAERVNNIERTRAGNVYLPAVDIYETENEIVLLSDMPGVDESSIDVTVDHDVLTIQAKAAPVQFEGYNLAYGEYGFGDYLRSFTLGETIDREKIHASYKNGVLELHLPKAEPAKPKKINVQVN